MAIGGAEVVDARNKSRTTRDVFGGKFELTGSFSRRHCIEFASGSANDDAMDAVFDLAFQNVAKCAIVDRQVGRKRRDYRRINTVKLHRLLPPHSAGPRCRATLLAALCCVLSRATNRCRERDSLSSN